MEYREYLLWFVSSNKNFHLKHINVISDDGHLDLRLTKVVRVRDANSNNNPTASLSRLDFKHILGIPKTFY